MPVGKPGALMAVVAVAAGVAQGVDLEWAGHARNNTENGVIAPAQPLEIVVESHPVQAAASARVVFTTNSGLSWASQAMEHYGTVQYESNDRWRKQLGVFPEGAVIRYAIEVIGANTTIWDNNGGLDYFVTVSNAAAAVRWIGNMYTWPEYGSLDPGADLWVNVETWPPGVAVSAEVGYSTNDGAAWSVAPMAAGDPRNGHDAWYVNLGGFPEGATVRFYTSARNANGHPFWDSNTGSDYRVRVNSLIRDVYTDKGRYDPGETAQLMVDLYNTGSPVAGAVTVSVKWLAREIASFRQEVNLPPWTGQTLSFPWVTPADDFRGYSVDAELVVDGQARDARSSAADVSSDWTRFPRYGFFSDYYPGDDAAAKARELAKFHINAVQFYDWMWTHDRLVPYHQGQPANIFTQAEGRVQSFQTITSKVAAAKSRNMFTMAYSLIYGDSGNNNAPEQPAWAAFKVPGSTNVADVRHHDPGYKIWVMDVTHPDWKAHLFGQFRDAMDKAGFEGIHLDNLGGAWNYKYHSDDGIPEWTGFPQFINEARADLRTVNPDARVTHNDVAENYRDAIAASDADVYYTEVWGRHTYGDIREAILNARAAGGGKPVVLAAYINRQSWDEMSDPTRPPRPTYINDASARLMDACVFAHGGFHIELGEGGEMLVNEYFPLRSPRMHAGLKRSMRDYYDFAVRYQNFFTFNTLGNIHDGTDGMRLSSPTHALSKYADAGTVWAVARLWRDEYDALNLINLVGVDNAWRNTSPNPAPQADIQLKYYVDKKVQRLYVATPDDGLGRPRELAFTEGADGGGYYVEFTVPSLEYWDLVVVDKRTDIKVDGWPGDWTGEAPANIHAVTVDDGEWIYTGEANDFRTFGGATPDADITEVRFTCDETYLYGLVRMQNITNAELPAIGIAWRANPGPGSFPRIGDASTPTASIGLENSDQHATREIMIYSAGGTAKIRLYNGSGWYVPNALDSAVAVSPGDNGLEFRVNRYDLDLFYPQEVTVSLASFRSSGTEAGSDATYDTPDGNNDAIDVLGGDVGVSANAWARDLDNNSIGRRYRILFNQQGADVSLHFAWPTYDGQRIDVLTGETYVVVARFTETLPAVTNDFLFTVNGVAQDRSGYFFQDERPGDFMNEIRFPWTDTGSGSRTIEVFYAASGFSLSASRTVNLNPDSDGDGIRDALEDINRNDVYNAPYETSFTNTDTDADGLADGFEDGNRDGRITGDANNNYRHDAGEQWWETDPRNPDTDGDGLPDGWEVEHGLNPWDDGIVGHTNMNTAAAVMNDLHGAAGDPDGDGMSNKAEYIAGTDPRNPYSFFGLAGVSNAAEGVFFFSWPSATGRTYSLQVSTNLLEPFASWSNGILATPPTNVLRDAGGANDARRFYRVGVTYPGAP